MREVQLAYLVKVSSEDGMYHVSTTRFREVESVSDNLYAAIEEMDKKLEEIKNERSRCVSRRAYTAGVVLPSNSLQMNARKEQGERVPVLRTKLNQELA